LSAGSDNRRRNPPTIAGLIFQQRLKRAYNDTCNDHAVTAKFHNPSLSRRTEWQRASRPDRDTKQFCIDGWGNGDFGKSVTTASIDNNLYSAIQKLSERRNQTTARMGKLNTERVSRSQSTTRTGRSTQPITVPSSSSFLSPSPS
jgi:hypothetical protein